MGISDDNGFPGDGETITTVNEHLNPGTDVGGYVVDGELGSGGMGVVYSATHPVIGKRAAIKVLKPELSRNPAAVERFVMEARAVNQIGHPNIVDIFAFGVLPDGRSYYVMDYLQGETLRRRLKRGPMHVSEASSVIDEVSSALLAAHDKGIIHRDLKPDNVFMVQVPGRWPEVRILDWGLLKLSSTQSAVSNSRYRTLAGSVMGTPVYMSPEQARASDSVDFRTDIYSLGVMAFEILSGAVPFKKGSSIDTLLAHQDDPVPSLAAKCPALPDELVQLVEAMLAKEAEGRPTLAAVRAVLKRLKGTKIPTMTAAGLEMPPGPGTPFVEPPTNSHPTVDNQAKRTPAGALDPNRAAFAPAGVPIYDPSPRRSAEIDLTPSMELTRPRAAGPISEAMPLPAPPPTPLPDQPSLPYDSINVLSQQTLAGHSMPAINRDSKLKTPVPGSLSNLPPGVSMQHQQFPPLMAPGAGPYDSQGPQYAQGPYGSQGPQYGSQNPQYASQNPQYASQNPQYASGPQPQMSQQLQPAPSNARRYIVIVAAAVIVSAIGIVLLLMS